jgi:hypothetical protein
MHLGTIRGAKERAILLGITHVVKAGTRERNQDVDHKVKRGHFGGTQLKYRGHL